jgi:uncharacterized protein YcgL (UPF0745 family)
VPNVTVYVVVPFDKGTDIVPLQIRKELGELVEFKQLEMNPGERRVGADVDKVLEQIRENGYAVQRTNVEIQEYVLGNT